MEENTNKALVGNILKIENFDPLSIDITYIVETLKLLPKNGNIPHSTAEFLATKFLRCAEYSSSLVAQAARWKAQKDLETKRAKARAIAKKLEVKTPATAVSNGAFGDDEDYVEAQSRSAIADAYYQLVNEKYDNLMSAHILCKDIFKREASNLQQSGWTSGSENDAESKDDEFDDQKKTGEVSWD